MSTDTSMLDLVSIIERYAPVRLTRVSNAHGGEWAGPCMFCGGRDRLRCWPNAEKAHYWCRGCLKRGDTLDFIMQFLDKSYREACEELSIEPGAEYTVPQRALAGVDDPPSKTWQDMAGLVAEKAERYLWTPAGKPALDYLRGRGLDDEMIKQAHLGYFPTDEQGKWYSQPFSVWGLDESLLTPDQQKKGCVRVPDGIIILWFASGQLWKLAVKRPFATGNELQYGQILGSKECLFNADTIYPNRPVLLCEAVFDALSAQQEAGNLISCVATDGVKSCRSGRWIAQLAQSPVSLIAFDVDDNRAGDKEAQYWLDVLPHSMRWQPWSHDINDMLKAKQDIRHWVAMGLSIATAPVGAFDNSEPLTIPTSTQEPVLASTQAKNDAFNAWLASLEIEKDAIDLCNMCFDEAEYYSPENVPYCEKCWQQLQVPASMKERSCALCGRIEVQQREDGRWLCRCYFEPELRPDVTVSLPSTSTKPQKTFLEYKV